MLKINLHKDLVILTGLFVINLLIQNFNLGKVVYTFTDEGVYLYSAKLLAEGLIPYQDFFLAHPLYLLYIVGLVLGLVDFNLNTFHFIYTIWFFSAIVPIYLTVYHLTKNRTATILSVILFSTSAELVQWDAHFFALRQASLPLLAFSLYFLLVKLKYKIAGILLGVFALCLVSNLLLAFSFIVAIILSGILTKKQLPFIFTFGLISLIGYLLILLIPNSFNNLISYQLERTFIPYSLRLEWIKIYLLPHNWPILAIGLISSLMIFRQYRQMGFFNILSTLIVIFAGSSFFPHYLSSLSIGFSISSGILIAQLSRSFLTSFITSILIITITFLSSYNHLKFHLIETATPQFFQVVDQLKDTPEPLFTFEPIYALYAKKDLTFHYFAADMRYFRILNQNLTEKQYLEILQSSNAVLLEPFANSLIPSSTLQYIEQNFNLKFSDPIHQVYARH